MWQEEHFSVGGPKNYDLVYSLLHVLDVFPDLVDALLVGANEHIVDSILLVGSDELLVHDRLERDDLLKFRLERVEKTRLKNMSSLGCVEQVSIVDVPAGDLKVNWACHWHDVFDWLEDVLKFTILLAVLVPNMSCGTLSERPMEVWMGNAILSLPRLLKLVCKNSGGESRSVISSKTHKHDSELWYLSDRLNGVGNLLVHRLLTSIIKERDSLLISINNNFVLHG